MVCASEHEVYYAEHRPRLATNRDHRGSGKALKPGLPHYGGLRGFGAFCVVLAQESPHPNPLPSGRRGGGWEREPEEMVNR